MVTSLPHLAILGAGSMGGAILAGLAGPEVKTSGIRVTTASEKSAEALVTKGIEAASLESHPSANKWAVEGADLIVLGVKPQYILGLLEEIAPQLKSSAIVISVAAGVTLGRMKAVWPGALVRAMPNTPSAVGKGVTGIAFGDNLSDLHKEWTLGLFQTVGEVLVVPEDSINALSAFSGSGPAFVYMFIEEFLAAATTHGFTPQQAEVMVLGTVSGAMELLAQSGKTPQELRAAVTSPGGSTQAALEVFQSANIGTIITEATHRAIVRAGELGG
jgi:pyrroline-5-carboxylate reductase